MIKTKINMKNGDNFRVNFEVPEMSTRNFLKQHIFGDFDKNNSLNINCFQKEDGKMVAVTMEDISSVEIL